MGQSEELQLLEESDLSASVSLFLTYDYTHFLAPNLTDLPRGINPEVYLRFQVECLLVDQQRKVHKISAFLMLYKKLSYKFGKQLQ